MIVHPCERQNTGEGCSQAKDPPTPSDLMDIGVKGNCRQIPADGASSVLERALALAPGRYALEYGFLLDAGLYDFCQGGTSGTLQLRFNGADIGADHVASVAGACSTSSVSGSASLPFDVAGPGTLSVVVNAGDCAAVRSQVLGMRVRRFIDPMPTVAIEP